MQFESEAENVIDRLGLNGRTAVLVSFTMPASGLISGNTLSRADIQSLRTDDLASEKKFFAVLKALGEIGAAALSGAPRVDSCSSTPFEFKGDRLGMSLTDFKDKHRRDRNGVTAPFCSSHGPTSEPWHENASIVHCTLDSPLEKSERTVGGAVVNLLLYEFIDNQLCRIQMTFPRDDFLRVDESMRQKFGIPIRDEKRPRQAVWSNGISSAHLMYDGGKQESGLVFVHEELFAILRERRDTQDVDL